MRTKSQQNKTNNAKQELFQDNLSGPQILIKQDNESNDDYCKYIFCYDDYSVFYIIEHCNKCCSPKMPHKYFFEIHTN